MKTNTNQALQIKSRKISAQKKLPTIIFVLMLTLSACGGASGVNESLIRTQVALEAQQTALSEGLTSASEPQQPQATETLSDLEPTATVEAPTVASTTAPAATATTGGRRVYLVFLKLLAQVLAEVKLAKSILAGQLPAGAQHSAQGGHRHALRLLVGLVFLRVQNLLARDGRPAPHLVHLGKASLLKKLLDKRQAGAVGKAETLDQK